MGQARRLSLQSPQTPGNLIKAGLQVRLERRHGLKDLCPRGGGRVRERLPLRQSGVKKPLGLRRPQGLQRFVPYLHERYDQRCQGMTVIDVQSSIQLRLATGGIDEVECLGDHVVQFAGLFFRPRQPVVSKTRAGFVKS